MQPEKDEKKEHQCAVCKMQFHTKKNLDRHLRTHTGEKPHECDICKRKFSQSGNLLSHKRIHSDERPFICNYTDCGYTAKRKDTLITHVKLAHKEAIVSEVIITPPKKPKKAKEVHKCHKCDKSFEWLSTLTLHLTSHEKKRPCSCDICKKTFKHKYQLNRHMKKVHPQEETASSSKQCTEDTSKNIHSSEEVKVKPNLQSSTQTLPHETTVDQNVLSAAEILLQMRSRRLEAEEENTSDFENHQLQNN
ncbi:zinc finger protein 254-like [Centruroides sculpturatus]|uniref:zinc finger protein 254-like n=1 Tax=Centruroides sculpturatus TaxID=218467 RepID=UPI000C6CF3DB|nr:zinc finger protein 254-like [Centruroides sculpturatus]